MQLGNKNIIDWKTILIDTNIILSLFRAQNGSVDPEILFVNKLINYLCKSKTGKGENRTFYISTVSLGEIITKENDSDKIKRILKVLDSENIEFLSYDTSTALEFNIRLQPYINKDSLHVKAQELGFKAQDYGLARQWIYADYMIAMTGFVKKSDVLITLDKNTFYPICNDFKGTDCILAYSELFEHTEQFILKYHYDKVGEFINP